MKYLAVLSLLAVVLFNLSSGIRLADYEEVEAIADAHSRVVRAIFINPSGIFASQTRASTNSRSTRSSGSKRSPPPYGTPTVSYPSSTTSSYPPPTGRVVTTRPIASPIMGIIGGANTSMFNSTICRQAYVEVIDQCLTAHGLNLSNLTRGLSPNNTAAYMSVLIRLINILCGDSDCRASIMNAYEACIPGISGSPIMKYLDHTLDVLCKVNEFGTTCAKTFIDLSTRLGPYMSVCRTNRTGDCRRLDSPCRAALQEFSGSAGCCALEIYRLVIEAAKLFSGNSTDSSMAMHPKDPWTFCGLPSPGLCGGGFTTGTPSTPTKARVVALT